MAAGMSASLSERIKFAFTEPKSVEAKLLLKLLSLGAGGFLVLAGLVGFCTTPFMGGGAVYAIGALYAVFFGAIVLTLEIKDKTSLISAFYQWLDTYLKFLTLQVLWSVDAIMRSHAAVFERGWVAHTRAVSSRVRSVARAPSTLAWAS